jgi:outer membrane protein TolC
MIIDNLTTLINTRIALVKIQAAYFSAIAEIAEVVGEGSQNYRGVQ